jgi:hypothetical protein
MYAGTNVLQLNQLHPVCNSATKKHGRTHVQTEVLQQSDTHPELVSRLDHLTY